MNQDTIGTSSEHQQGLIGKLVQYGLTRSQAEIYLVLLANGPSDVPSICRSTGIHRSDIYRRVKELQEYKIIDCIISSPSKKYRAVSPRTVLELLEAKIKRSLDMLSKGSKELAHSLDALMKLEKKEDVTSGLRDSIRNHSSMFTLISGRKRYWHETKAMVREARHEVLRIVDEEGLKTMFATDLFEEFKSAAGRGVTIKLLSEITPTNLTEANTCAKYFQIKHLRGLALRFIEVDSTGVILCGLLDRNSPSDGNFDQAKFLKFYDSKFAQVMQLFFDGLWTIAQPIERIIPAS